MLKATRVSAEGIMALHHPDLRSLYDLKVPYYPASCTLSHR